MILRITNILLVIAAFLPLVGCVTDVLVSTTPTGAEIYCNSELVGKSPCKVPLPEKSPEGMIGMNVIEARLDGYMPEYYYLSYVDKNATKQPTIKITLTKLMEEVEAPQLASAKNSLTPSMKGPYLGQVCTEARIYRVKDLRCLGQASLYAQAAVPEKVAELLAGQLAACIKDDSSASVRVCSMRNRRMSTFGQAFAETLTTSLMRELCFCGGIPNVDTIDLTQWYQPKDFDLEKTLKDMKKQGRLFMADYVVIGGVAEHVKP